MNFTPKFCGKCGESLEEGIRFCGKCGAPIAHSPDRDPIKPRPRRVNPPPKRVEKQDRSQPKKSEPIPPAPEKSPRECDSFLSKNSVGSGLQWALVWLIGWLPIGVLFSGFYDRIRAGNPTFYSNYPRTWDTTLPGMLTTYGIGSLLGGFLAGLLIYRILNKKELSMGALGILPALAWGLLWGGVLAVMTLPLEEYMDDDTLIITIPILALIFGGLVSRIAARLLEKKYSFSATKKAKRSIAALWAVCSLFGVIVAMVFSDI